MKFWFITGSQFLYGEETLRQVEENSKTIVAGLKLPFPVEYKLTAKTESEIEKIVTSALPDMYEHNRGLFQSTPIYRGVQELGESAVVIRVTVDCLEKDYFVATRRLNREMKILFDDNGITVPFNQLDVHNV